jgi:hypothetical protein
MTFSINANDSHLHYWLFIHTVLAYRLWFHTVLALLRMILIRNGGGGGSRAV